MSSSCCNARTKTNKKGVVICVACQKPCGRKK
nr:MAG TPA: zinc finger domain protein [Caudoviricetes sp.]